LRFLIQTACQFATALDAHIHVDVFELAARPYETSLVPYQFHAFEFADHVG
jgi:hypothetical protein